MKNLVESLLRKLKTYNSGKRNTTKNWPAAMNKLPAFFRLKLVS
jgi:hypothetical protein